MKLKCNNCKNEWEYKGNNPYYATCTRCLRKVKVDDSLNNSKNVVGGFPQTKEEIEKKRKLLGGH